MQVFNGAWRDIGLATRSLRATPVVTAAAILSLALGIGANSAIFSLIDGLVLRPLPGVAEPAQLVTLSAGSSNPAAPRWPYAFWREIQARAPLFGGTLAWSGARFDVAAGGDAERLDGAFVSGRYFSTLGVAPVIGRTFTDADEAPGSDGARTAVVSHAFWQRRFASAPTVLGTSLTIDGIPFTIVGVLPPAFLGTEVGRGLDVAVPLGAEPLIRGSDSVLQPPADRASYWLTVAVRLGAGQTVDAATALLRGVQPQIREAAQPQVQGRPLAFLTEPLSLTRVATGTSSLRAAYRQPLLALLLAAGLVLLLACANIANLQLARATARAHELSVRSALGAARWRLARLLLIESLLLAALGAAGGLLVASWAGEAMVAAMSTSASRIALDLPLDWRVLLFTTLVAGATAVLFGSAPALFAGRASPIDAIKARGRGLAGGSRGGVSSGLVGAQVALSLVIVVFAELFVGTFQHLVQRPLGFEPGHVLLVRADAGRASAAASRGAFFDRLVAAAAAAPGVTRAAGSFTPPVSGGYSNAFVQVPGTPQQPAGPAIRASWNFVTPGWFATYGTPLRAGRDFDGHDIAGAAPVVIVNESFVRKFLPQGAAVGRTIDAGGGVRGEIAFGTKTIVGVVGDAVFASLREAPQPTMYFPLAQWFLPFPMDFVLNIGVRTAAAPAALAPVVRTALAGVDASVRVDFRTLDAQVSDSLAQERLLAGLSAGFAGVALLLAAIGLYGVTAYTVARRRTELGVRMALGAGQGEIVWLALRRVAILVGAGVALGGCASFALSRSIAALLYGFDAGSLGVLAAASLLLAGVAAAASGWPAWRAARMDPASALRQD